MTAEAPIDMKAQRDVRAYAARNAAAINADWQAQDGRTTAQKARDDLASLPPERRAELNKEWEE